MRNVTLWGMGPGSGQLSYFKPQNGNTWVCSRNKFLYKIKNFRTKKTLVRIYLDEDRSIKTNENPDHKVSALPTELIVLGMR